MRLLSQEGGGIFQGDLPILNLAELVSVERAACCVVSVGKRSHNMSVLVAEIVSHVFFSFMSFHPGTQGHNP